MNSDVLDVAIGVVFVWFLLSVVLSAVNEGLALVTHVRAKHLWLGIGRLVDPDNSPLPRRFLDAAFRVPLWSRGDLRPVSEEPGMGTVERRGWQARVAGKLVEIVKWFTMRPHRKDPQLDELRRRTQGIYDELRPQLIEIAKSGRLSKITHVASEAMADAVLSLARNVHSEDLKQTAVELKWDATKRKELTQLLASAPDSKRLSSDDLVSLLEASDGQELDESRVRALYAAAAKRLTVRDLSDFFKDNPDLAKTVRRAAMAVDLDERAAAVKKVIEDGFNRGMEQMTRFYRRQNRKIMAVLAIPVVIVLQTNSIAIARNLWHDQNLRVATANAAATETATSALLVGCNPSAGATTATTAPETTDATDGEVRDEALLEQARQRFDCAADVIGDASQFRVGFALDELKSAHGEQGKSAEFQIADVWPFFTDNLSWLGRLITWGALLFGAEFWFDVLRRMVGLRKVVSGNAPPLTT